MPSSPQRQKQFWTERFRNAGWQAERFVQGMRTATNFYSQEAVQVRTNTWYKGRVVLVGDAAHCASPFSGMGVSGGLVGAYVLVGQINRNGEDFARALAFNDQTLRPFVEQIQRVNPSLLCPGIPKTRFGISVLLSIASLAVWLRIPDLVARFSSQDRGGSWLLPDYAELHASHQGSQLLS